MELKHKKESGLYIIITGTVILLLMLLTSCRTPKERFDRLVIKHPELMQTVRVDTIRDTLKISEVKLDTFFLLKPIDTIIIEKERLKIKIIRKIDSFRVEGKCDSVEKIIEKKINVPGATITKEVIPEWVKWFIIALGAVAFTLGIILMLKK